MFIVVVHFFDFTPLSHPLCGVEHMICTSAIPNYIQITCMWAVAGMLFNKMQGRFLSVFVTRELDSFNKTLRQFTVEIPAICDEKILLEWFLWWNLMRCEAQPNTTRALVQTWINVKFVTVQHVHLQTDILSVFILVIGLNLAHRLAQTTCYYTERR